MAAVVGSLIISLRANVAELKESLDYATSAVTTATNKWQANLGKLSGPLGSLRGSLSKLGIGASTAVGGIADLFQGLAGVGLKAGIWGAAIGGVALAIHQIVKNSEETKKAERQFRVLNETFGVTSRDITQVRAVFAETGKTLSVEVARGLIATGAQAKLTVPQMVSLAEEVKRIADLTGKSIPEAAAEAFGKFRDRAREAIDDLKAMLADLDSRLGGKTGDELRIDGRIKEIEAEVSAAKAWEGATRAQVEGGARGFRGLSALERVAALRAAEEKLNGLTANRIALEGQLAEAIKLKEDILGRISDLEDAELGKAAFRKKAALDQAEADKARAAGLRARARAAEEAKKAEEEADRLLTASPAFGDALKWGDPTNADAERTQTFARLEEELAALQSPGETKREGLVGAVTDADIERYDRLTEAIARVKREQEATKVITAELAATFADVLIQPLLHGLDSVKDALAAINRLVERIISSLIENAILLALGASTGGIGGAILTKLGFAEGGYVSGPGGPRSDSIPAFLSSGEYVIPADAVAHYGRNFMEAIRERMYPRFAFASGGFVSPALGVGSRGSGAGGHVFYINALDPKTTAEVIEDRISPAQRIRYENRQAGMEAVALSRMLAAPRSR